MTVYHLVYIPSKQYHNVPISNSLLNSLNITNLEDAEKILAAEFYTSYAKKCERNINNPNNTSFVQKEYQEELQTMTKQFLEETPREFLRLNNFEVVKE